MDPRSSSSGFKVLTKQGEHGFGAYAVNRRDGEWVFFVSEWSQECQRYYSSHVSNSYLDTESFFMIVKCSPIFIYYTFKVWFLRSESLITIFFSSTKMSSVFGLLGISVLVFSVIFFLWLVSGLRARAGSRLPTLAKSSVTYSTRTTPLPPPLYRLIPNLCWPSLCIHFILHTSLPVWHINQSKSSILQTTYDSNQAVPIAVFPEAWGPLLTYSFPSHHLIPSGIRQEEMVGKTSTLICQMHHHYLSTLMVVFPTGV